MAELAATMLRLTLLLLVVGCISAKRFAIMAPNVFHIGVKEQVSIAVFDAGNPVNVKLYLQDYPHRKKTFSQVQGRVDQGSNIFLPVKVEPENLLDISSVDKQYVYLVAKSDDGHFQFHKEAKILLSYKDRMVFIQTDKPIYTPRQRVHIQVFPLEFDMKPSQRKITVVVMNPQGIKVQQWKDLHTSTGIISKSFDPDDSILMGNWTITAVYGHQNIHNTSVQFEVKEYVLPKFSVKLKAPPYILKTDNQIKINITTRYTYGKPVIGSAAVYLSIAERNGQNVPFAKHNIELDSSGVTTLTERIRIIQKLPENLWFPEDSRLQIQADVIERATGNKESALDKSCKFTSSPYLIEFKNTATYFKPGLRFVVKVVVTYPNKQPARNVPVLISAKGRRANGMVELRTFNRFPNVRHRTDILGEAEFVVHSCANCVVITIEVRTDNNKLNDSQNAVANYVAKPFDAENGPLIMVRQLTQGKVGRKIQCESYRSRNDGATKLSFAVVSRGRILSHNTTGPFDGMFKSWSFRITSQMSPSARLIGYYIDSNGRVVADSILLKVEDTLPTTVDFPDAFKDQVGGQRVQLNEVEKRPGTQYTLKVRAPQGTRLGLLCVDQSIYLLRNENRLTKERIFKTAEALDLGCGVGGGKNSKDIFKNAGVVLITENFVSDGRKDYGCGDDYSRKKRSAADDKKNGEICCDMGKNTRNLTWGELPVDSTKHLSTARHDTKGTTRIRRSGLNVGEFGDFGPSDEEIIGQTEVRSYFPERWILDENLVGPDGLVLIDITIPGTPTTWIMQAVAINNQTGLGLATPLRIVANREYFVSLNMPYSVKRGEQITILPTFFNCHEGEMRAKLYLMGNKKDFCSVAADDKFTLIGTVEVPSNDARSVSVPIFPKRIGEVQIEVSTIVQMNVGSEENPIYMNIGGDAVRRKLLVVVAVNYNLTTSRNETCKFDLKTTVKVIREQTPGELFGPAQKGGLSRVQKKKAGKKKKGGKRSKSGCKGKNKNKRKCRNKGRKPTNKKKPQLKLVKSVQLKVCTRYRERGNTSSAIMDIGILTGFVPDLKSLQNLQTTLPEMDKYEVLYRSLVIYLSKVPSDRTLCVDVQFDREYDVGMVQAVPVKVYYYEPDESCSVFYGLDKTSMLRLGICYVGSAYCKCRNDNEKCAPQDPPIGNIDSLINKACTMYHYVIKGKVLLITRNRDAMIEYVVDVLQIIQQGNKVLKLGQRIELLKHRDCVWSPDLKELEDYLFMGLEKGDRYSLDGSSFVKLWPKRPANNKDKVILENFAAQYAC